VVVIDQWYSRDEAMGPKDAMETIFEWKNIQPEYTGMYTGSVGKGDIIDTTADTFLNGTNIVLDFGNMDIFAVAIKMDPKINCEYDPVEIRIYVFG
jgi:hypothetical protein